MALTMTKTGTTCIGLKYKDGVMLAADRRATTYKIASDKMIKIFEVSKNAVSTIAGEAASAQLFMRYLASEVKLLELKKERRAKISEIASILNSVQYSAVRSQGSVVASILGGYGEKGAKLFDMSPDGTMSDNEEYLADGSGSLWAKGVLDDDFRENLSEKEAIDLLERCFKVAFKNDNASGGGFIVKVVTKDGIREVERKVIKSELIREERR